MADAATMTIKAVILPDEIQTTLKDLTFSYTPADANDKWFYSLTLIRHDSSANLIGTGGYLSNSAGVLSASATETVATTDKVKFLFIKNTGTTDGSATAGDAISYSGSPRPVLIGADADTATPTGADLFNGAIDEVAIFNTEITSAQRTKIYNYGVADDLAQMAGLIGYWRMGDPDGQSSYPTIVDVTSNGNNGTMTNMTAADITGDVP